MHNCKCKKLASEYDKYTKVPNAGIKVTNHYILGIRSVWPEQKHEVNS